MRWNDGTRNTFNLLITHGSCSMQHVQEEIAKYLHDATRKRQNSYQLFVYLTSTVDEHTRNMLVNDQYIYTHAGTPCRITYLKLIIQKAELDTRATASYIRSQPTKLDVYMVKEAQHNFLNFNKHVNDLMNSLLTRGETISDIIVNLLRGYWRVQTRNSLSTLRNVVTVTKKANT
jgi:hypothetical protein